MNFFFFLAFYAEIQDGCQKWPENNFWKNHQLTADTHGGGAGGGVSEISSKLLYLTPFLR